MSVRPSSVLGGVFVMERLELNESVGKTEHLSAGGETTRIFRSKVPVPDG